MNLVLLPASLGLEVANAQFLPIDEDAYTDTFVGAQGDTAVSKTSSVVISIVKAGQYILALVVILLGVISSIEMMSSEGNDEKFEKGKKGIIFSVVGLILMALAWEMSKVVDLTNGGILGSREEILKRTQIFDNSVRIIITFVKYIIGSFGVLMIVRSSLRMVMYGGTDEEIANDKKAILAIGIGLALLIFIDSLIKRVFYVIDNPFVNPIIDVPGVVAELAGFTNLVVTFAGPLAILAMVIAALMYVMSGGNEDNQNTAKKMIIASLIGIIIIYGTFGLVSTFIIGTF